MLPPPSRTSTWAADAAAHSFDLDVPEPQLGDADGDGDGGGGGDGDGGEAGHAEGGGKGAAGYGLVRGSKARRERREVKAAAKSWAAEHAAEATTVRGACWRSRACA